jgi:hypothetical protein
LSAALLLFINPFKNKKMKTTSIQLRTALIILVIGIAMMVSAVSAKAQSTQPAQAGQTARSTDSTRTPEGRAAALTEKMKKELSLTDDQYPSVQALNLKYAQQNERIFKGSDGKFAKYKALKSSQKDKSKEMKAALTSDQYKKYEAMVEEMKSKAREQYKRN